MIPKDNTINPLGTDPTLILFVCEHLPLTTARDVNFVADPALENQFCLIISYQFTTGSISVKTLSI